MFGWFVLESTRWRPPHHTRFTCTQWTVNNEQHESILWHVDVRLSSIYLYQSDFGEQVEKIFWFVLCLPCWSMHDTRNLCSHDRWLVYDAINQNLSRNIGFFRLKKKYASWTGVFFVLFAQTSVVKTVTFKKGLIVNERDYISRLLNLFSCIIKWVHSAKTQSGIVTISQDKALLVLLFINFTAQIL